jgi:hypothetical protein
MNLKMGLVILGLCFPSLINRTPVTQGGLFPFFPDLFNPLNAKLNPIFQLLALLGAHHILHVSGLRVNFVDNLASIFLPFINGIIMVVILITVSTTIAQKHKECCLEDWKKSFYVSE